MKNDYLSNYTRRYGEFEKADFTEDKDILKGKIEAIDEKGKPLPGGISADETTLQLILLRIRKSKNIHQENLKMIPLTSISGRLSQRL